MASVGHRGDSVLDGSAVSVDGSGEDDDDQIVRMSRMGDKLRKSSGF